MAEFSNPIFWLGFSFAWMTVALIAVAVISIVNRAPPPGPPPWSPNQAYLDQVEANIAHKVSNNHRSV